MLILTLAAGSLVASLDCANEAGFRKCEIFEIKYSL